MDGPSQVIAANARAIRARQQRRQVDVAAAGGISRSTLSLIESGQRRVTVEDVAALCAGLGVGVADLLAGADDALLRILRLP